MKKMIPVIPRIKEEVAVSKRRSIESFLDLYHFSFGSYSRPSIIDFYGTVKAMCENGGKVSVNLNGYTLLADGTRNLTEQTNK